jgi:hypothetical protein
MHNSTQYLQRDSYISARPRFTFGSNTQNVADLQLELGTGG